MKFIYLTDVHVTGVNPGRRKDVYYLAILKKLWELTPVIKQEKIDFVVIGGDLFDVPKVSNKLYGQIARIMRGWGVKIFVVPGNHDLYGENIDTLEHTSLGALASAGVVTIMTRDKSPFYFQKKSEPGCPLVAFTGQEYYKGIDSGVNNDYDAEPSTAQFNIVVAHGMLVAKPFHPNVKHTVIANAVTTADMVLSGHYHPERFDFVHGKTRFVKPESTARQEATEHNIKTKPEYSIIEITQNGVDVQFYQYQTAAEGKDIFDRDSLVEAKENKSTLQAFQKTMADINVQNANSIGEILKLVSQALNSNTSHVGMATTRLTNAQKTRSDVSLNGYVPKITPVQLVKVIIKNFQSHAYTEVDFDMNALNALIGESDHGKTSILRAIKWVLYNDPKGDDFIRRGETSCEVTLVFSNGNTVTRKRTKSSAGSYEVYDSSTGKTETYTGFSHTIPIEVYNAHQMPKVEVGKEQVSFNIAEQLDGAFMLSQSAGDKAAIIGKITGVQVVDEAIKQASGEVSALQRSVKDIEREITKLDEDINNNFADLPVKEANILMAEAILDSMDATRNDIQAYTNLQSEIDNFNIGLANETTYYNQFANLDDVAIVIDRIDLENEKRLSYEAMNRDYLNNATYIAEEEAKLKAFPDFAEVNSLVDIISAEYANLQELKKLQYEYEEVEKLVAKEKESLSKLSQLDNISVNELETLYSYFTQLQELYTQYSEVEQNIFDTNNAIGIQAAYIEEQTTKYRQLLSTMGTCPICSNKLDEHTICSIEL